MRNPKTNKKKLRTLKEQKTKKYLKQLQIKKIPMK
jgi:hypothetical protein